MDPLTREIPKSLLRVGNLTVLDWILSAITARTWAEIVVVTGFAAPRVEAHVAGRYPCRVTCTRNDRYDEDLNILSVDVGVSALKYPERGYLIVETDLLIDESGWDLIFEKCRDSPGSYWICKDRYGSELTGGIVGTNADGRITQIRYEPEYEPEFDGFHKMLGMVSVGPGEVVADRRLRRARIARSIAQYYLSPWQDDIEALPSTVLDLGDCFARSFNTIADFQEASSQFVRQREGSR